jgi:hypothetical protein
MALVELAQRTGLDARVAEPSFVMDGLPRSEILFPVID